jgi:8-oxo-dGTP diphosphatase
MQVQANIIVTPNLTSIDQLQLVAIVSSMNGKWLWVRNKARDTWELPGGHIEPGETPDEAATRELFEETGAINYHIKPLFDYTVQLDGATSHGRMFYAEIKEIGPLPESEIGEVKAFTLIPSKLTYQRVQPRLFEMAIEYLKG